MRKTAERNKKEGQAVTTWMSRDLVERIDKLAARASISRSRMITNMVELSVEGLERADRYGFLSFAILMRDCEENMKAWVRAVRDEGELIRADYENNDLRSYGWDEL